MKIFTSGQIKEIDAATIRNEPVSSTGLMERAAGKLFGWIAENIDRSGRFVIFTGPGNNGGDGLVLARMLAVRNYEVEVFYINFTEKTSADWQVNQKRLENETSVKLININAADDFPEIHNDDIIIDAIFGSGLTKPASGLAGEIIKLINHSGARIVSVDIPSGLFGEDNSNNSLDNVIKADYTLSFQFPKLAFMFPENHIFTGEWILLPIGLDNRTILSTQTPYCFLGNRDIRPLIKKRGKFDHKGIYGHGFLIAGSIGKMGSAVLSARAALRTGLGLLTCQIPSSGRMVLQCSVPEAMTISDRNENFISEIADSRHYDAIGIGPGLDTNSETQQSLRNLLSVSGKPVVIDADGLNILSLNKNWLNHLPPGTIITPHPKEFERLAGKSENSFNRLEKQIAFSKDYGCIVVLKGAHTTVTTPDGKVFFNSTGNPGMATAGSGDVLTGIILSLLAQGYSPENASLTGVYLHGLAGDIAARELSYESILASDIINCIGSAFNRIKELTP